MTVWEDLRSFCDLKSLSTSPFLSPSRRGTAIIFLGAVMDEAVSAHVHYNAYHLFFSARLSALQEMPERYIGAAEKERVGWGGVGGGRWGGETLIWFLWREFAARCVLTCCAVIHQSLMKMLPGHCLFLNETHLSLGMNGKQSPVSMQRKTFAQTFAQKKLIMVGASTGRRVLNV